jgi:hypothetical protein
VGQADFVPIRPNPGDSAYPGGALLSDLLTWDTTNNNPPSAWTPVSLFGFAGDYVTYPRFADGYTDTGTPMPLYYLFSRDFLLASGPFLAGQSEAALSARWPLSRRAVMYVSQNQAPIVNVNNPNDRNRAEALFVWDGADGLENGEYIMYVGTFMPNLAQKLTSADLAAANAAGETVPYLLTGFAANNLLAKDPSNDPVLRPVLGIQDITDRSKAQGLAAAGVGGAATAPGLVNPDDWNTAPYKADSDGYIFYGNNTSGSWQPKIVRVTDNYLAVRIRNMGGAGQMGVVTHIVLAPRKRVPGKINVNTVENRVVRVGSDYQLFNPLLGLPGVVDALTSVRPYPTATDPNPVPFGGSIRTGDDIAAPTLPVVEGAPWPAPAAFVGGLAVPPTNSSPENTDFLAPPYADTSINSARPEDEVAALRLSSLMMYGRNEHADGRYYTNINDLTRDQSAFSHPAPALSTGPIYPLSNEDDAKRRFDEVVERFRRMSNLITTRSDVFEIIATVQAGYGIDQNGDGLFDYRSNDEFVTTAETKGRLVYERRAPSDRSDQAD